MKPTAHLGDDRISRPEVQWNTHVSVPRAPSEVWVLLRTIGLRSENGAGYFLPRVIEQHLPEDLRSIDPAGSSSAHTLRKIGDKLRDIPRDSWATVAVMSSSERTLVLDVTWPATDKRPRGLHYTWMLRVEDSQNDTSVVHVRVRIEHYRRPRILSLIGPPLDRWVMKMIARGLAERIPAEPGQVKASTTLHDKVVARLVSGLMKRWEVRE